LLVPYLLQQRLTVAIGESYGAALSPEQLQRMLQRLNPSLSDAEIASAVTEMDSNGNGVITGQELSTWFIRSELDIALLDSATFRDPAPAKKKDISGTQSAKPKKRAKPKKKASGSERQSDVVGNDLNSSMAHDGGVSDEESDARVNDKDEGAKVVRAAEEKIGEKEEKEEMQDNEEEEEKEEEKEEEEEEEEKEEEKEEEDGD
jgi:hypothetical protein